MSDTSADARASISEETISELQQRVLKRISKSGWLGQTDEELQRGLKMNPSTQRPRRRELCLRDLVLDSGRQRKVKSGRNAIVWVTKPFSGMRVSAEGSSPVGVKKKASK